MYYKYLDRVPTYKKNIADKKKTYEYALGTQKFRDFRDSRNVRLLQHLPPAFYF